MIRRVASLIVAAIVASACETSKTPKFAGCDRVDDGPICVIKPSVTTTISVWVEGGVFKKIPVHGAASTLSLGRYALPIAVESVARKADITTSTTARAHLARGEWQEAVRLFDRAAAAHAKSGARSQAILDLQAAAYALVFSGHRPAEASVRLDRAEPWLETYPEGWALQPYYRALVARASADPRTALTELATAKTRLAMFELHDLVLGVKEVESHALAQLGRKHEARELLRELANSSSGTACARARRLSNVAWLALVEADQKRRAAPEETRTVLERAHALYETPACHTTRGREVLLIHLALERLLAGDLDAAETWIQSASKKAPGLEAQLWREEIIARIALGRARYDEAIAGFDRALNRARRTLTLDAIWRLEIWRARTLLAAGREAPALNAYASAEAILDDTILRVPFDTGRGAFLADRTESAREWASRLLQTDQPKEAACVLRRSRARAFMRAVRGARLAALNETSRATWAREVGETQRLFTALEQRAEAAWDLPADERAAFDREQNALIAEARAHVAKALSAIEADAPSSSCEDLHQPAPGELILLFHPLDEDLAGFAISAQGVRWHRFDHNTEDWLSPFDEEIARAERIRIVTTGRAALHAARWRDRPLNAAKIVAYALDVPIRAETTGAPHTATLVIDPRRNLAGARAEGEKIRDLLQQAGWKVDTLQGKQATPIAVTKAIASSGLFHYAGHAGAVDRPATNDHLALSGGELDAEQVLVAADAPRTVVLTGCRTAMLKSEEDAQSLSLAHAFLLAGATQVLAATDEVDDRYSSTLAIELYRDAKADLASAFHHAIRKDQPERWSAFRVWVL